MANETARTFGWNAHQFISQAISFVIVAFLLHRFAYKPILQVLAERRARIAEGLANAERIKEELARTEAARQEIMEKANIHANKLIEEARTAALRVQEQETQKAIATAEMILAKAREAADLDYTQKMADLKREIGRLVIETTAQVTGKILTPQDRQRILEESTKELVS